MSQEEQERISGKLLGAAGAAIAAFLVGWLFTTHQDLATGKQWQVDHELMHKHEQTNCAEYRANLRREVDRLYAICDGLEEELEEAQRRDETRHRTN